MKVIVGGKIINLTQRDYKGAGGEGTVYCKDGLGFKIYHDTKKVIPTQKVQELSQIGLDNVLGPKDIVLSYNSNKPVGFTMPYVDNVEFLCKLFTKSFRDRNNISPQAIVELVKSMQQTLSLIHKKRCLVVDYNEMNFLVDSKFQIPYYIDVDSYQTPTFRATALMESVRDRTRPKGKFSVLTDWFAFAVVTFQLYAGCHPYKGRHPDYKPKDWLKMMDDNVSVFDPDSRLPANCQDLSLIPKPHLDWYKKVFAGADRSIPPMADQVIITTIAEPILLVGNDSFTIQEVGKFDSPIEAVYFINSIKYTVTRRWLYAGDKKIFEFTNNPTSRALTEVQGESPIIVQYFKDQEKVYFTDLAGELVDVLAADDMMEHNGLIYTVRNGILTENACTRLGKIVHQMRTVCNVFEPASKLLKGVVIQDILGKCWMALPYKPQACKNIHIKELDSYRILDAKYSSKICIVMAEKQGTYDRFIICFSDDHSTYTIRTDADVEIGTVNFAVLSKGLCITVINDLKVEAFFNNDKVKVIDNPPFDSSMKLINDGDKLLFIDKIRLYSATLC